MVCDAGAWEADSWGNAGQGFARQGYQKDTQAFCPRETEVKKGTLGSESPREELDGKDTLLTEWEVGW